MIAVPAVAQCLALMDQYAMLDNIRQHSFIVARVAEAIVKEMALPAGNGAAPPDLDLVLAGALLHDIAKTPCLDGSCRHAEAGQAICIEHGYPEVGEIVHDHVILSSFTPDIYRQGHFPAREIVYYADKRVRHDEIVSLEQRLEYIVERYANGSDSIKGRIRKNFDMCFELETCLFSFLPFEPEELAVRVTPASF